MKTAIELIQEERRRQIEEKGWTPQHDDQHTNGELAAAAGVYALGAAGEIPGMDIEPDDLLEYWPWDVLWLKPTSSLRDLVKAGALIVAEIERQQRVTFESAQDVFLTRARKQLRNIQELFDDVAHWNAMWPNEKIEADPDGSLARIAKGLEDYIAKDAVSRAAT